MKKLTILFGCVAALSLTACADKKEASNKNFKAALASYFEKKGDVCLDFLHMPAELSEFEAASQKDKPTGRAKELAALEAAGLVKGEMRDISEMNLATKKHFQVKHYEFTEAATPFLLAHNDKKLLCWGKQTVADVIKWRGPVKAGQYEEAEVVFTYKISNIASWAKRDDVQAAFPQVKSGIEGEGKAERVRVVELTSEGWESKKSFFDIR